MRPLARPFLVCEIGSGITGKFWHDNWTGHGSLIDIAGSIGPQMLGLPIDAVVRDAIRDRNWMISSSCSRNPTILLIKSVLPSPENIIDCLLDDTYCWKPDQQAPSNKFSAKKTWLALHPPTAPVPWCNSVWFKDRIPKHAFIAWVVGASGTVYMHSLQFS